MKRVLGSVAALLGLAFGLSFAAERLHPAGIEGNLLLCGSRPALSIVESFVEMAGQEKAKVVILAVAEEDADADANPLADLKKTLQARKAAAASRLVAGDKGELDVEPLRQATGVWIDGGGPAGRLAALAKIPGIEKELRGLLQRGGVVAAHAAATPLLCQEFVKDSGQTVPGFGLLPGFLFDPRPEGAKPALSELLSRDSLRSLVGLTLSERAALLVRGRGLHGSDEGSVSFFLGKGIGREPRTITLKPRTNQDLTLLRRCALARSGPAFPPREAPVPKVHSGSLVIVGGGGMPPEVAREFIELAGGPEALIVVLPTAQPDPVPLTEGAFLQRAGAKNVIVLPGRDLRAVEDPNNLETLKKDAKGIWFGGGRQWRFVDAYEGTKALELFRDVLKRGGVIGGSSAGATIQGDYLCRGSPVGNLEMMCEGYERGLAFLPGTAIDQHFSQRNRFADMAALMKTYPQLLGIGIDETTALIVRGQVGAVMGKGQVHFFDRTRPIPEGQLDHESVKAGGRYDLKERKTLPPKGK